jgi:hypothetical protein
MFSEEECKEAEELSLLAKAAFDKSLLNAEENADYHVMIREEQNS